MNTDTLAQRQVERESVTVQIYDGYVQRPLPNGNKCPFGCSGYDIGYATAVAVAAGQSQRFYSGVGIFDWYYLSSPTQILLLPRAPP
jgi:hypothetical protein